jgi:hypothetical protein
MPAGTEPAAAGSVDIPSFSIAGAQSDTQTEDAILDGTPPAEGAGSGTPAGTEPAGKTAEPGQEPAAGAVADGKQVEGQDGQQAAAEALAPAQIPAELTALLKDPQVAAKLQPIMPKIQAAFDQNTAYRELYPTVREAREFRETFPTLEDAKAAATKSALLDEADDQFAGTPDQQRALAAEWADSDVVAFRSMYTEAGRVFAEKDPQGYAQAIEQSAKDWIRTAEWDEQIAGMAEALKTNDLDRLKGMVAWLVQDAGKRQVQWNPKTGRTDPNMEAAQREREAATTERQAALTERIQFFQQQVGGSCETQIRGTITKSLEQTLKDSAFTDDGKKAIAQEIYAQLDDKIKADKATQRALVQIIKANGKVDTSNVARQKAVALLTGRAKALLAGVAKAVIERRTKEVVASTTQINDKRDANANRREVGAGGATPVVRTRKLTPKDTAAMTDDEIMDA